MSSILKALEKVEDAQNGRRSGGSAGIGRRREKRAAWVMPVCVIAGAAVASLATFAAMGGFSGAKATAQQKVAVAAPAVSQVAPTAAPTAAVPAPAASAQVAPVQPQAAPAQHQVAPAAASAPAAQAAPAIPAAQHQAVVKAAPATAAASPAAATARKAESAGKKISSPNKVESVKVAKAVPERKQPVHAEKHPVPPVPSAAKAAPAAPAPQPTPAAVAAAPALPGPGQQDPKVTGIAWQGNSESSFAMINGRAMRQGAVVDGLKVERIFEESVRFSGANGSFTVQLGAGE